MPYRPLSDAAMSDTRGTNVLPAVEAFPRWTLTKASHDVKAFARSTPGGPELLIHVDGEPIWSHVYRHADPITFAAAVDAKRAEFLAEGWN